MTTSQMDLSAADLSNADLSPLPSVWSAVDVTALYPSTNFWLYGNAFPSATEGWAVGESDTAAVIIHLHQ